MVDLASLKFIGYGRRWDRCAGVERGKRGRGIILLVVLALGIWWKCRYLRRRGKQRHELLARDSAGGEIGRSARRMVEANGGKLSQSDEHTPMEQIRSRGLDPDALSSSQSSIGEVIFTAQARDGRLPVVDHPSLFAEPGEVVHYELPAALLKEVVDRRYQAGYGGVSVRMTKRVSVRTGGVRGKQVVVRSHIEGADQGTLSVTSTRVVLKGARRRSSTSTRS
jgi:hypothetical protein